MKVLLATVVAAAAAGSAFAQHFEIKGYGVGRALADCPAETVKRSVRGRAITCQLGATTVANQPANVVYITIFDGQVTSYGFGLEARGRNASGPLLEALVERFGRPSIERGHVNEYYWDVGTERLALDGWKGLLMVIDRVALERQRREEAQTNKKDM